MVIAGIVGSGGLGETIYGAIRTLDIAKSIDAAIAIVILTMVLDRLTQSAVRLNAGGQDMNSRPVLAGHLPGAGGRLAQRQPAPAVHGHQRPDRSRSWAASKRRCSSHRPSC